MISSVCICGAGTMGCGIAQVTAMHGFTTVLFDVNTEVVANAHLTISANLNKLAAKGTITKDDAASVLALITFTTNLQDCRAELIIEAIVEKLEVKRQLFNQLADINPPHTIFATNTSSLSVSAIAGNVVHPDRVAGLHFFNPAYVMKLVEIVRGSNTSDAVITTLQQVATRLNKVPVVCKDGPGFIVNRVARQFYLEALRLVENGTADIETIDNILEASGFKMGPFRLMDLIGLDINYAASHGVYESLGSPVRLQPSALQKEMVDNGRLGKKTGHGFYKYQALP